MARPGTTKVEVCLDLELYPCTTIDVPPGKFAWPYDIYDVPTDVADRWRDAVESFRRAVGEAEQWVLAHPHPHPEVDVDADGPPQ